jgi:hypothetical protein
VLEIVVLSNPFIAGLIACRGRASQKKGCADYLLPFRPHCSFSVVGLRSTLQAPKKSPSTTRFRQIELPALDSLRHYLGLTFGINGRAVLIRLNQTAWLGRSQLIDRFDDQIRTAPSKVHAGDSLAKISVFKNSNFHESAIDVPESAANSDDKLGEMGNLVVLLCPPRLKTPAHLIPALNLHGGSSLEPKPRCPPTY